MLDHRCLLLRSFARQFVGGPDPVCIWGTSTTQFPATVSPWQVSLRQVQVQVLEPVLVQEQVAQARVAPVPELAPLQVLVPAELVRELPLVPWQRSNLALELEAGSLVEREQALVLGQARAVGSESEVALPVVPEQLAMAPSAELVPVWVPVREQRVQVALELLRVVVAGVEVCPELEPSELLVAAEWERPVWEPREPELREPELREPELREREQQER
jgi:hypothetical protein